MNRFLSSSQLRDLALNLRTHIIFGSNTDVGKTICSAGLAKASKGSNYIKPLQCGGSDQDFVERHLDPGENVRTQTLFNWETPASPHIASILENKPVCDNEVLSAIKEALLKIREHSSAAWLETAGGALSPSSASPKNSMPHHAVTDSWGWTTQADLYRPLSGISSAVLVGDGKLGGISATLSSLESLLQRGYNVQCIILIEQDGFDNVSALREYADCQFKLRSDIEGDLFRNPTVSIVSVPEIPPEPEPLVEWYNSDRVSKTFQALNDFLDNSWIERVKKSKN